MKRPLHEQPFSQDFEAMDGTLLHAEWQVEKQTWRLTDAETGEWFGDWWKLDLSTETPHAYPPAEQVRRPHVRE